MSLPGQWKAATIANNGTSSDEVDLGRSYDYLDIQIPTVTSCTLKVQVAEVTGGTFRDLGESLTTQVTTGAYNDVWRLGGYQFIKIVSSATQGAERLIRVRGMAL